MKPTTRILAIVFLSLIAETAFAQVSGKPAAPESGSGTRGGGEVTDVNGHPELRDLVDHTVCTWQRGADFVRLLTDLPNVLDTLRATHWYFADRIEDEAAKLNICLAEGDLVKIPSYDDVTIYEHDTKQVAIRFLDRIYLNVPLFNQLDPHSQAYLWIHEVMHSFIPWDVPQRMSKLRSMVAQIQKNETTPIPQDDFGYQMQMNGVAIIARTKDIDPFRTDVANMRNGSLPIETRFFSALRLVNQSWQTQTLFQTEIPVAREIVESLRTLLDQAFKEGNDEVVLHWLEAGVRPDFGFGELIDNDTSSTIRTRALAGGRTAILQYLIDHQLPLVNDKREDVHLVALSLNKDALLLVLNAIHLDFNSPEVFWYYGDPLLIQLVDKLDDNSEAATSYFASLLDIPGINVNIAYSPDRGGRTPVSSATDECKPVFLRSLLAHGASVPSEILRNDFLLMLAENTEAMQKKSCADAARQVIRAPDAHRNKIWLTYEKGDTSYENLTLLFYAADHGNLPIVRELLNFPGMPLKQKVGRIITDRNDKKHKRRLTAREAAIERGYTEIAKLIEQAEKAAELRK